MTAAALDAVTVDAYGTLVTLVDPVPALQAALAERGVTRDRAAVSAGFRAEVAHYVEHSAQGHDEPGLARLQRDCAGVFLRAVAAPLDPAEFAPAFSGAMHFEVIPGAQAGLDAIRSLGLELAVVANWDLTLRTRLSETGLDRHFTTIVHAAGKPAPEGLLRALGQLGVAPERALHIGDDEADEAAARTAGMRFAPAPLSSAVAQLT